MQETDLAYAYTSDDPVNEIDPTGMMAGAPDAQLCEQHNNCPKGGGNILAAISHLGHWMRKHITTVAHVIGKNLATIIQVGAAAACVVVSAGACAVIVIASVSIQLLDEAATRKLTLSNASETVLLGLSDLGGAEVMSQMEKIAAVARPELKDLTEKVVLHALSSIIAAPDVIVAVSERH